MPLFIERVIIMSDYQNYANNAEAVSRMAVDVQEESLKRASRKTERLIDERLTELYATSQENYKKGIQTEIDNLDGIINNKANDRSVIDEAVKKKSELMRNLNNATEGEALRLSFDKKTALQGFILEAQKAGIYVSGVSAGGQYYAVISTKDSEFADKFAENHNVSVKRYAKDDLNFFSHQTTSGSSFRDISFASQIGGKVKQHRENKINYITNTAIPELNKKLEKIELDLVSAKGDKKTQLEGDKAHIQKLLKIHYEKLEKEQKKLEKLEKSEAVSNAYEAERIAYNASETTFSSIKNDLATTEAGASQMKMNRALNTVSNYIIRGARESTTDLRLATWSALAMTQREVQKFENDLKDTSKNANADFSFDETTKQIKGKDGKQAYIDTQSDAKFKTKENLPSFKKLDKVNTHEMLDKVGKKTGTDLIHSKNLTKDVIEARTKLLNEYSDVIKLDRKGNIDTKALMDLVNKKGFGKGDHIPTLEEAKFLITTTQVGYPKTHPIAKKATARAVRDVDGIEDFEKLRARSEQTYKVVRAGYTLTRNEVRLKVKALDINRTKHLNERINNLSGEKKEKLEKKLKKHDDKAEKQAEKLSRRNKKRAKKQEKKDKRRDFFYNHTGVIGKASKKRHEMTNSFRNKLQSSWLGKRIKKFRKYTGMLLLGAGGIVLVMIILAGALNGTGAAVSTILSFFDADKEDTVAYNLYEVLTEMENEWNDAGSELCLEDLSDDYSNGMWWWETLNWANIKFTDDYIGIEDYLKKSGYGSRLIYEPNADGTEGKLCIQPFGFRPKNNVDDIVEYIDESDDFDKDLSNWTVETAGDSSHTSNVKDIICMMDIMYGLDSEGALKQKLTDGVVINEIKNVVQSVWNRIKCIGNIFGLCDDPYEDETMSYFTMKSYCKDLFNLSHQETIELKYEQKYIFRNLDGTELTDDEYTALPAGTAKCPEKEGCGKADCFFYDNYGNLMLEGEDGIMYTVFSGNASTVHIEDNNTAGGTPINKDVYSSQVFPKEGDICVFPTPKSLGITQEQFDNLNSTELGRMAIAKMQYEKASSDSCWKKQEDTKTVSGSVKTTGTSSYISQYTSTNALPEDKTEYFYSGGTTYKKVTSYSYETKEGYYTSYPQSANPSIGSTVPATDNRNRLTPTERPVPAREQTMAKKGDKKKPASTPKPTATPKPTKKPTATPKPTATQKPSVSPTPYPTGISAPTATPEPTSTPEPTPTPEPTFTLFVVETVTQENYTHECKGDHTAHFCKGHVGCDLHGKVYSFSQTQIDGGDEGETEEPKLVDVDYSSPVNAKNSGLNVLLDGNHWWTTTKEAESYTDFDTRLKLGLLQDIFDVDLSIYYGEEMFPVGHKLRNFESWNKTNMSLALLKYTQDWYQLYEFDIPENIGTCSLSSADILKIVNGVKQAYSGFAPVSDAREKAITLALSCVGNGSYDMNHHGHAYLWRKCNGHDCHITDCSGFASYIFMCADPERYHGGLTTVETTVGLANGQPHFKDAGYNGKTPLSTDGNGMQYGWWAIRPGDMIIHSSGHSASEHVAGSVHHALIYIGMLSEDITLQSGQIVKCGQPITVECLTIANKGNIYLTNCWENRTLDDSELNYMPHYFSGGYSNGYVIKAVERIGSDNNLYIRKFDDN